MKTTTRTIIIAFCILFSFMVEGTQTAHAATTHNAARSAHNGRKARKARKAAKQADKANKTAVKAYARATYGPEYKVVFVPADKLTERQLTTRAGKKVIYAEVYNVKTTGGTSATVRTGKYKGNFIRLPRPVKAGKNAKVIYVYNPHTNADDDVTAICSGGTLKAY